eukprot:CAMPEP_0195127958 /NCGR_PEP_ID=MMETSP0448-20130528/138174_1 /TAXON_ID=66468 /ORGANISM="Heterocapsa triquestra, Strain CCMP 448" /LENGTH=1027 /DNA_ID=CAMNT_0040165737 /DNA_START=32 /DNA_END=3115 /DNA_ORIENTATION=-
MACHICVLTGNMKTASAMRDIGTSTAGWSRVGLGLSRSFNIELDHLMDQVSTQLIDTLSHMTVVQESIDMVMSLVGNETDAAINTTSTQVALLQSQATVGQPGQANYSDVIVPMIMNSVRQGLNVTVSRVTQLMDDLMRRIRPVLLQIGQWITRFSDNVMNGLDAFSTSMDRVQDIFDQVMSQLNGHGEGSDEMLFQTFNLFDVSNTGSVTQEDLENVANLYGINALEGSKPQELMQRYDRDNSSGLDRDEMALLVEDETVPMIMSVVLRQYARRLAEIGGAVASVHMRGDVAKQVTHYLQLVCANNATKVTWVSDALGNGSLPLDFTSAMFAQLCLEEQRPGQLTTADVGGMVINRMFELHPENTLRAVDNMANNTFWEVNGFNILDHPHCMQRVTQWVVQAQGNATQAAQVAQANGGSSPPSLLHIGSSLDTGFGGMAHMNAEVLAAMPAAARRLAEGRMRAHLQGKMQARAAYRSQMYASDTSKALMKHLLRDTPASTAASTNPNVARAVNSGQPAAEETLQWAQWLKNNATTNSNYKQNLCFVYSGQSSSTMDSFATQIQAMVTRVQSFIRMMEEYATPAGIQRLEDQVQEFATNALNDVVAVIEERIQGLVTTAAPQVEAALDNAIQHAGDVIGHQVADALTNPVIGAITDPIGDILGNVIGSNTTGQNIAGVLVPTLGDTLSNGAADAIGGQISGLMDQLLHGVLGSLNNTVSSALGGPQPSLLGLKTETRIEQKQVPGLSGVWTQVTDVLHSLTNLVPTASNTLREARNVVSSAASQLDSIFAVFEVRGPSIFNTVSKWYSLIWVLYFVFVTPLTLFTLYYGFWAGGFFGGPMPIPEEEVTMQPPQTWREKIYVLLSSCSICCTKYHDTQFCFWSTIIFMQVLVLVVFLISVVLCILAGIKAFVVSGCAQVYILGDPTVCTQTIDMLRSFLSTFFVAEAVETLDDVCPANNLMTCQLITQKMKSSTILTTIFSFLGAIFSLQMLIDSAVLHEQARFRRMYHQKVLDEGEAQRDEGQATMI